MHGDVALMRGNTRRKSLRDRYKSGKLKPIDNEQHGTRWRRIKDHAMAMGADPDMGSVVGRLSMAGILTDREATAAIWVAETVGRYERMMGMPCRMGASPAYARAYDLDGNSGDTVSENERRVAKAKKAYERLYRLIPTKPSLAGTIIEDVCCGDEEVNSAHHGDLATWLRMIAKDRGLS